MTACLRLHVSLFYRHASSAPSRRPYRSKTWWNQVNTQYGNNQVLFTFNKIPNHGSKKNPKTYRQEM